MVYALQASTRAALSEIHVKPHLRPFVPLLLFAWALVVVPARPAAAESIAIGVVSFDVFLPGDGDTPGVNAINLLNLTGDPLAGGFALDPDFPSHTEITLLNASLTLVVDGVPQLLALGDIGPGLFDPTLALLFSDTASISSLILTATLSTTALRRGDGTALTAASQMVMLTMLPLVDGALVPGLDLAVISIDADTSTPVPAPGAFVLLVAGISACALRARRRGRQPPRA